MCPTTTSTPTRTGASSSASTTAARTGSGTPSPSTTASAKNLTFDLRTGVSYDYYLDGERQDPTAIIRNGQIYVSASSTCRYFGLRYTYSNIAFGDSSYPFVRIWNSNAALSDAQFISAANTSYLIQLQNYYRTVMGQTGGDGGESPAPSESTPSTTPGAETDRRGVRVYLAIRCETSEAGEEMLDSLRVNGYGALLLFPADQAGPAGRPDPPGDGGGARVGLLPRRAARARPGGVGGRP